MFYEIENNMSFFSDTFNIDCEKRIHLYREKRIHLYREKKDPSFFMMDPIVNQRWSPYCWQVALQQSLLPLPNDRPISRSFN